MESKGRFSNPFSFSSVNMRTAEAMLETMDFWTEAGPAGANTCAPTGVFSTPSVVNAYRLANSNAQRSLRQGKATQFLAYSSQCQPGDSYTVECGDFFFCAQSRFVAGKCPDMTRWDAAERRCVFSAQCRRFKALLA